MHFHRHSYDVVVVGARAAGAATDELEVLASLPPLPRDPRAVGTLAELASR